MTLTTTRRFCSKVEYIDYYYRGVTMSLKDDLRAALDKRDYPAAIALIQGSKLPEDEKQRRIGIVQERMKAEQAQADEDTLKAHIATGNYGQARELLERVDHPQKAAMLAEIDRRIAGTPAPQPVQEPERETPPVRRVDSGQSQRATRLILFTIVTIIVVPLVGHVINSYINRYQWRMEDVCRTVYRDDWLDDTITFNQLYYGCQAAAARSISTYGEEVAYCFNNQNGTERMFMACLATEDVFISAAPLRQTAP